MVRTLRLALAPLVFLPNVAHAALFIYCGGLPGCPSGFTERFSNVLNLLLLRLPAYVQVLGILFIMIGGAYILLSGGNDEYVTKGKNTIIWAVIAIFVTDFASTLLNFVVLEVNTRASGSDLVVSIASTLAGSILNLFYIALVAVAVYCGMRMVLSFGKEDQFNKAKDGLFYAALGGIVINLAVAIFNAFSTL